MFGISQHEIEKKLAEKATERMIRDHKVHVPGFGTVSYNQLTKRYSFEPDLQLEQKMNRTGQ